MCYVLSFLFFRLRCWACLEVSRLVGGITCEKTSETGW